MKCSCGAKLIRLRQWRKWTPEERKASGGKPVGAGGKCQACYFRDRRGNTPRTTWKLPELVDETEFLLQGGASSEEAAKQLGVKHKSLIRMFYRAKARGLTKRTIKESRRQW